MPRSAAIAELLAVLAPPACATCAEPLSRAELLVCASCLRALPWLHGWRCPRCALPRHSARGCPARGAALPKRGAAVGFEGHGPVAGGGAEVPRRPRARRADGRADRR